MPQGKHTTLSPLPPGYNIHTNSPPLPACLTQGASTHTCMWATLTTVLTQGYKKRKEFSLSLAQRTWQPQAVPAVKHQVSAGCVREGVHGWVSDGTWEVWEGIGWQEIPRGYCLGGRRAEVGCHTLELMLHAGQPGTHTTAHTLGPTHIICRWIDLGASFVTS